DVWLLPDAVFGQRRANGDGERRVLCLCAVGRRANASAFPQCRAEWALTACGRTCLSPAGGAGGAVRACETDGVQNAPRRRSLVALQPRGLSPPVSTLIRGPRPCARSSLSAHAALGTVPGSARRRARTRGARVPRPARTTIEPG